MCGRRKLCLPLSRILCIWNNFFICFVVLSIAWDEYAICDFGLIQTVVPEVRCPKNMLSPILEQTRTLQKVKIARSSTLYISSSPQYQVVYTRLISERLKVYWNVPTVQCKSKGIRFEDLSKRFGIHQNTEDAFRGDAVTILYDPGNFPALLENVSNKKLFFRNGGVPQEGDLKLHLDEFEKQMHQLVPNQYFDGVGIIDFESWRPVYRQNFGVLAIYKNVSVDIEKRRHRFWPQSRLVAEAARRFELAGRQFMAATLEAARRLRPRARWGYYAYPYCFNMASSNMREECAPKVTGENDRISWLWDESLVLYPSLYLPHRLTAEQKTRLVRGRAREAERVARPDSEVLPYLWYKYQDKTDTFVNKNDLRNVLKTLYQSGSTGLVIWGSSDDVNTKEKCQRLLEYVNKVLGPAVVSFTKRDPRQTSQKLFKNVTFT